MSHINQGRIRERPRNKGTVWYCIELCSDNQEIDFDLIREIYLVVKPLIDNRDFKNLQSELHWQNFSQKFCALTQGQVESQGWPGWSQGVKLWTWFDEASFFSWIFRQWTDQSRSFFFFLRGGVASFSVSRVGRSAASCWANRYTWHSNKNTIKYYCQQWLVTQLSMQLTCLQVLLRIVCAIAQ